MKRLFLVSALLFVLALTVCPTFAVNPQPPILSVDRAVYKPMHLTLNFPYTHDHEIINITTIGQTQYSHTLTPTSLQFLADEVDVYTFIVHLRYENFTPRTFLLAFWEGDRPMQGETLASSDTDVTIAFTLSVTEQPSFPDPATVANEVLQKIQTIVVTQIEENRRMQADNANLSITNSIVNMIAVTVSLVSLTLILWLTRKIRMAT